MSMPLATLPVATSEALSLLLISHDPADAQRLEALHKVPWLRGLQVEATLAGALGRLAQSVPSAILLNPEVGEFAVASSWRMLREHAPGVPILVLAASGEDAAVLAAMRAGADDYVTHAELHDAPLHRALRTALARSRERRQLDVHLQHAARMEALGQLAGGVVHDLNNLLQVVVANLYLLEPVVQQDQEALKRLQNARRSVARNAELVKRLLSFSRQEQIETKIIDPNELVAALRDLLARTLGRNVQFKTILEPAAWAICVDPSQLESVLVNLAINSRDAIPQGGSVTISTRNEVLDEISASTLDRAPGDYVAIVVNDDGEGIPPEVLSKVFAPFFTTKAPGRGSGLGLSMVRAFVAHAQGAVSIDSSVGRGTTVTLLLPRAISKQVSRLDETVQVAPLRLQGIRVLVADPAADVREAVCATLESLGFATLAASGPAELARLAEDHPDVTLFLVDDTLDAASTGAALARHGKPVLWMSANGEATDSSDAKRPLRKPIARGTLANAIHAATKNAEV